MRKTVSFFMFGLILFLLSSCVTVTKETTTTVSKEITHTSKEPETLVNDKIYENGELAYVQTEKGNFYFGVIKAEFVPKSQSHEDLYHIMWEYHNESYQDNGEGLNITPYDDFKVYDSDGYVVETSYYSNSDSLSGLKASDHLYDKLAVGKKCKAESNFHVNNSSCNYLDVVLDDYGINCRVRIENFTEKIGSVEMTEATQKIMGTWEAEGYLIDDKVINENAVNMSVLFISDGTGKITLGEKNYAIAWRFNERTENKLQYTIEMSEDIRTAVIVDEYRHKFNEKLIMMLDSDTVVVFEKQSIFD